MSLAYLTSAVLTHTRPAVRTLASALLANPLASTRVIVCIVLSSLFYLCRSFTHSVSTICFRTLRRCSRLHRRQSCVVQASVPSVVSATLAPDPVVLTFVTFSLGVVLKLCFSTTFVIFGIVKPRAVVC